MKQETKGEVWEMIYLFVGATLVFWENRLSNTIFLKAVLSLGFLILWFRVFNKEELTTT